MCIDVSEKLSLEPVVSSLGLNFTLISSAGYSVAGGEFSGDDEEGEGCIYITERQNAWLSTEFTGPSPKHCLIFNCSAPHTWLYCERKQL